MKRIESRSPNKGLAETLAFDQDVVGDCRIRQELV